MRKSDEPRPKPTTAHENPFGREPAIILTEWMHLFSQAIGAHKLKGDKERLSKYSAALAARRWTVDEAKHNVKWLVDLHVRDAQTLILLPVLEQFSQHGQVVAGDLMFTLLLGSPAGRITRKPSTHVSFLEC